MINSFVLFSIPIILLAILSNVIFRTNQSLILPLEDFKISASTQFRSDNHNYPFYGKTVVVTGSTSGLGLSISRYFYQLGATVVIASRSLDKCHKIVSAMRDESNTAGILLPFHLDTSNMESVKNFSEYLKINHGSINFLINNAGIYSPITEKISASAQGYDQVFATNYLGHFLLSELLTPLLELGAHKSGINSIIMNIASQYHFASDGTMLDPPSFTAMNSTDQHHWISAARSDSDSYTHRIQAYPNSKLAQVLHAKELQKRFDLSKKPIRAYSVCPGVVETQMALTHLGTAASSYLYPSEIAPAVVLYGLLDRSLLGGEFLTNSRPIPFLDYSWVSQIMGWLGIRSMLSHSFLIVLVIVFQPFLFSPGAMVSSYESRNESLASNLYDWSKAQVSKWL